MNITGPQSKAARALVQWPREHVAKLAEISIADLQAFERGNVDPGEEVRQRLQAALESGGAVFLDETDAGRGVRLKFPRKEVRAIRNMENEGGPVGTDDV